MAQVQTVPCHVDFFTDGLPGRHDTAEGLVIGARELLYSSADADGGSVLLARARCGDEVLTFTADRDSFEFSLRTAEKKVHVAGGNLASELSGISVQALRQMVARRLRTGDPIELPARRSRKR